VFISGDEDTGVGALLLSNSPRFWKLFDNAARGKWTPFEDLRKVNDEKGWRRLAAENRKNS
jgi:hypothetical protein